MELNSVQGDVKRVIAQLYIALGRHTVDKGHVLDLTYQLETLTMIQAYPGEARAEFGEYQLTKSEWRIAAYLKERFGRVVSREALLSAMHPDVDSQPEIKIIDVFICKLRRKIDVAMQGGAHELLQTVWGRGYLLADPKVDLAPSPSMASEVRQITDDPPTGFVSNITINKAKQMGRDVWKKQRAAMAGRV